MAQINTELIPILNSSMDIELPGNISVEQLKEKLGQHINHLIQYDFQKLVSILYRIDVSEERLTLLLKENFEKEASSVIAELIIERQLQKIKSRQEFGRKNNINEEEKW